jgi:hypothetical protein
LQARDSTAALLERQEVSSANTVKTSSVSEVLSPEKCPKKSSAPSLAIPESSAACHSRTGLTALLLPCLCRRDKLAPLSGQQSARDSLRDSEEDLRYAEAGDRASAEPRHAVSCAKWLMASSSGVHAMSAHSASALSEATSARNRSIENGLFRPGVKNPAFRLACQFPSEFSPRHRQAGEFVVTSHSGIAWSELEARRSTPSS